MQPKKQLKVQYIGIFEEMDSLLTKNAVLKRGPKISGMGRPPPYHSGNARKKTFFFLQLMPSLKHSTTKCYVSLGANLCNCTFDVIFDLT